MSFVSLQFFTFALASVLLLRLQPRGLVKELLLFGLTSYFVASYFPSLRAILPLLGFVMLGYGALYAVEHIRLKYVLPAFLSLLVFLFAFLKHYSLLSSLEPKSWQEHSVAITVGLSYILFRIIHVLVDLSQGSVTRPSLLRYLNYCFFFPSFVSGPIQRYDDFEKQISQKAPALTVGSLDAALRRILLGIFMILVISSLAATVGTSGQNKFYAAAATPSSTFKTTLFLAWAAVLYLLNIFANFAGYMHIIIGVGTLIGFALPENFNKPYLAKNFLDLWARWHITLSDWFKFYVFNPVLKKLAQNWDGPKIGPYLGAIAFFATFLVMGVWHGTTGMFIFYGLFLGFGAMFCKMWQVAIAKKMGKKSYKELTQRDWYFQLSRGLTLSYFAVALICLWADPLKLAGLAKKALVLDAATCFAMMTLAIAVIGGLIDSLRRFTPDFLRSTTESSPTRMVVTLAIELFIIFNIVVAFGDSAPEFIYKAF